eukprot:1894891-Pyramimonas_sp.AAC.1
MESNGAGRPRQRAPRASRASLSKELQGMKEDMAAHNQLILNQVMQQGQAIQALQKRQLAIDIQGPEGGPPAALLQMPATPAFERGWQR